LDKFYHPSNASRRRGESRLLFRPEHGEGFAGPVECDVDAGFGAEHDDIVGDLFFLFAKLLELRRALFGDREGKRFLRPDRAGALIEEMRRRIAAHRIGE
jgi:hypothetical protein